MIFYIVADHPTDPDRITRVAVEADSEENATALGFDMLATAVVLGCYVPRLTATSRLGRYLFTFNDGRRLRLGTVDASSADEACACIDACLDRGNLVVPQEPIA
jgi:hypothetical protein